MKNIYKGWRTTLLGLFLLGVFVHQLNRDKEHYILLVIAVCLFAAPDTFFKNLSLWKNNGSK